MFNLDAKGKRVLVIPDTHLPYSHKHYIKFLTAIKEKYKPELAVHLGDELDYHAVSFHDSDSELFSAGHELDNAIIELQEGLHKLFPSMYLCESNHGSLLYRKMKHAGIPIRALKPLTELYETPLWSWHHEIILKTYIGRYYICHGKSAGYGKLAMAKGMHSIQGHYHGKMEITFHENGKYNIFSGCLVDKDSMAMAYGKNNLPQPVLGCTVIKKSGVPIQERMFLDRDGNWIGKLL